MSVNTHSSEQTSSPWLIGPRDALLLGRVSNLPTVWSNVLAAGVIAAIAAPGDITLLNSLYVMAAISLMYIGGMYLNDAFDAEIDAKERPERPIPSGRVGRKTVFIAGYGLLIAAILLLALYNIYAGVAGVALAGAVTAYNFHHKGFQLSPVVMGLTRLLVYVSAAAAFSASLWAGPVWLAGAMLLSWTVGLTYVAKQENIGVIRHAWPLVFLAAPLLYGLLKAPEQPMTLIFVAALAVWAGYALKLLMRRSAGDVPRAVVSLIAGIALVDAIIAAANGAPQFAFVCVIFFGLTLLFQRIVPGT